MPSYEVLADYGDEDEWETAVPKKGRKNAPPQTPPPVKPVAAATAPAAGTVVKRTEPSHAGPAPVSQAFPRAPPLRVTTHDNAGRPVAEDYYRAFQKCYKEAATGNVVLKFHKTNVVTITKDGDVQLFTNKYYTYTTLCSMNDALQFIDMKLTVKGEVKDPENWVVNVAGSTSQPYSDNMIIKARLPADKHRGAEVLEGMKVLLESADVTNNPNKQGNRVPVRGHAVTDSAGAGGSGSGRGAVVDSAAVVAAAPAPPSRPIVPANPAAVAPPVAKGSAWAASGKLASKLAAEATKPPPPPPPTGGAEFPPLGGAAGATRPAARPGPAQPPPPQPIRQPAAQQAAATPAPPSARTPGATPREQAAAMQLAPPTPPQPVPTPYVPANAANPTLPDSLDEVFNARIPVVDTFTAPPPLPYDANASSLFANPFMSGPSQAISQLYQQQTAEWGMDPAGGDDESKCAVCMHHLSNTILIPCGHTILCRSCADHVVSQLTPGSTGECPVCRTPVDLVLDVQ